MGNKLLIKNSMQHKRLNSMGVGKIEEKKLIIFIDSGDTIIDEKTEVRDDNCIVLKGNCIPGADVMLRALHGQGYRIALVADGLYQSFQNLFRYNGLYECLDALICSEALGVSKPHPLMFSAAMKALGLELEDIPRIIMVGNNLERDIRGANHMGITSIHLNWSPRYPRVPSRKDDIPDYVISEPMELIELVEKLNTINSGG